MGEIFECTLHPVPGGRYEPCQNCLDQALCRTQIQEMVLVDDDPDQAWELAEALEDSNRRIKVFVSAMETMRHLVTRACDVLLSDIDMPGMNGLQLATWVARESPRTRIVLISGRIHDPALGSRNWTFLRKPVDIPRLNALLQA